MGFFLINSLNSAFLHKIILKMLIIISSFCWWVWGLGMGFGCGVWVWVEGGWSLKDMHFTQSTNALLLNCYLSLKTSSNCFFRNPKLKTSPCPDKSQSMFPHWALKSSETFFTLIMLLWILFVVFPTFTSSLDISGCSNDFIWTSESFFSKIPQRFRIPVSECLFLHRVSRWQCELHQVFHIFRVCSIL